MPDPVIKLESEQSSDAPGGKRISVPEIAQQLGIDRLAVYAMLKQGIIPGIRVGRRWIITRHSYERWMRTCGTRDGAGLHSRPEVTMLN
jgi:excisionase family DNA binding protein